jgi:hypothetical protein
MSKLDERARWQVIDLWGTKKPLDIRGAPTSRRINAAAKYDDMVFGSEFFARVDGKDLRYEIDDVGERHQDIS